MKVNPQIRRFSFFSVLLLILLLSAQHGMAQTTYEDVVYLKNGSIIRGMIMEQIPNQSLKIQTADRNLFVFTFDEIEKITKEVVPDASKDKEKPEKSEYDRGRFTFIIEGNIGISAGIDNQGRRRAEVISGGGTVAFDVNIKQKFCIGLGSGFDAIDIYSFIPVFLDTRYFFSTKPFSPYLSAGLGYSIGPGAFDEGGWYVNPNFGLRYNFARKSALNFGIGWRLQTEKERRNFYTFTMLNLKVGAIF
jgi:hypothetical protein